MFVLFFLWRFVSAKYHSAFNKLYHFIFGESPETASFPRKGNDQKKKNGIPEVYARLSGDPK